MTCISSTRPISSATIRAYMLTETLIEAIEEYDGDLPLRRGVAVPDFQTIMRPRQARRDPFGRPRSSAHLVYRRAKGRCPLACLRALAGELPWGRCWRSCLPHGDARGSVVVRRDSPLRRFEAFDGSYRLRPIVPQFPAVFAEPACWPLPTRSRRFEQAPERLRVILLPQMA